MIKKPMTTKVDKDGRDCVGCGNYKLWPEFQRQKKSPTGYTARCKECIKKGMKQVYIEREAGAQSKYVNDFLINRFHLKKSA